MATTKKSDGKRSLKVGDAVRGELMNMLLSGEIHDPGVQNAVVSSVVVTDDLRLAKVYLRSIESEVDERTRKALLSACERAKGFMRRELAQRLKLRYAPDLRFYWDDSIDHGRAMEALLREIGTSDEPRKD